MQPFDDEWVEELRRQSETDPSFFSIHQRIDQLEPYYKQIIDTLPPDQQGIMAAYQSLSKKLEVWLTNHAYICGMQIGQRRHRSGGDNI